MKLPLIPKGPWAVINDAAHAGNRRITARARRHIAKVYADSAGPDPECEAIAQAIAALPALLWALEPIVRDWANAGGDHLPDDALLDDVDSTDLTVGDMKRAAAAYRLAVGE